MSSVKIGICKHVIVLGMCLCTVVSQFDRQFIKQAVRNMHFCQVHANLKMDICDYSDVLPMKTHEQILLTVVGIKATV